MQRPAYGSVSTFSIETLRNRFPIGVDFNDMVQVWVGFGDAVDVALGKLNGGEAAIGEVLWLGSDKTTSRRRSCLFLHTLWSSATVMSLTLTPLQGSTRNGFVHCTDELFV